MRTITGYHRPSTVDEALAILARVGVSSIVVAGGTVVNARAIDTDTQIVDLQSACTDTIEEKGNRVVIGSMARLQDLVDSRVVPPLLRELAHREGPNTLRNAATIGGTVASADPESELLAGLLVHEATAEIERGVGSPTLPIVDLLADLGLLDGGIITSISVARGGATASARTGRTPADVSIVAAVGRASDEGLLLALTGVAPTPILATRPAIDALDPASDFRGSSEYRRDLAGTLIDRVIARLGGVA